MTGQPPDAYREGADPANKQIVLALDGYRRAVSAVALPTEAASVRARAERRTARNRAVTAVVAAASVVAVIAGAVTLADSVNRQRRPEGGPVPATQVPATSASATIPAPCRSATLFPRLGRPTIAGSEVTSSIELINLGAPCSVSGQIALQLRSDNGTLITTSVQREPGTAAAITIPTGHSAVAGIAWTWSDGSGTRCQSATEVAVTAPGDTEGVTAPWVAGDAGSVCRGVVKLYPFTQ